jgi:hypothetical protein
VYLSQTVPPGLVGLYGAVGQLHNT